MTHQNSTEIKSKHGKNPVKDETTSDDNEASSTTMDSISEVKAGMVSDVKNLYESKPDRRGNTSWVDKYPDDIEEAAENAESARFALLIRNKKCYDGRKSLEIDSIVVQSPLLKESLGRILHDYPGITTSLDRLTFQKPFRPFVHRWKQLVEELENEKGVEANAHLTLLHSVLGAELKHDLKAREDFILNGVITYETAWMIFEPGAIIFNIDHGEQRAARFSNGNYVETRCGNAYTLNCQIVDWDGAAFGLNNLSINVWQWEGTKKITQLSAFPLQYHPQLEKTSDLLINRGKKFQALSGYNYRYYSGVAIGQGPWGPIRYMVDSRIIIDTYAWNRFNPNKQVSLNALGSSSTNSQSPSSEDDDSEEEYEDDDMDRCDVDTPMEGGSDSGFKHILTQEQLLLCTASVKGYSLKNKKWLTFSVDLVKDISYNDKAFDSLVLPKDHKELILALADSQVQNKGNFDDIVQGKGKGMIMLLSGPPGVGKTLTAEAVAEVMRTPLYMMSAGDLGLDSDAVESSLSNVLEMATKWNAILLLDEADVFLEQRSLHDLERNKLVSIFLRILEYYEGILFLTTNRVDNIDAAFQSRIHLSMEYNELTPASRKHVWNTFLKTSAKDGKVSVNEKDLDRLAQYNMNGREIKNILKTAQLLANKRGVNVGAEHVESIMAIEKRRRVN